MPKGCYVHGPKPYLIRNCKVCGDPFLTKMARTPCCSELCYFTHYVVIKDPANPCDSCHLWVGTIKRNRYGGSVYNGEPLGAHVRSYRLFNGEVPKGAFVCHTCHVPLCVNPRHLKLGDPQSNMDDMVESNRSLRGERARDSKLTESQVLEIFNDKLTDRLVLAERYCVAGSSIDQIRNGKNWYWLTGCPRPKPQNRTNRRRKH